MALKPGNIDLVKNLGRRRFVRCGILPYYFHRKRLFIYVGLDAKFKELTDFAGRASKNEDYIVTAARELNEEGRFAFETPTYQQLRDCVCIYNKTDIVIFMPTRRTPSYVITVFRAKLNLTRAQRNKRVFNEMADIYLFNERLIQSELLENKSSLMYERFYKLIRGAVTSIEDLKSALLKRQE